MPTGSEPIWLEAPERLKGIVSFHTDLNEINILSDFEATPPKKKAEKIQAHVRGKHNNTNGNLF
jgi:hypothetical protein